MRKNALKAAITFAVLLIMSVTTMSSAAGDVLEDFEGELVKYPADKMGWEANSGAFSSSSITQTADAKNGTGAGEIELKVKPGGWALVQKKVEGADSLTKNPKGISFWLKGQGSGKMIVELEESYSFKWRKEVPLDDRNWHQVKLNFSDFTCGMKPAMSVSDLVVVKFVSLDGDQKFWVDDIQFETDAPAEEQAASN